MEEIAKLVITLMHARTAAHVLHLQAVGPGSKARHEALGEFYGGVVGLTDKLAEVYQGHQHAIIAPYPDGYVNPAQNGAPSDALEFMQALSDFVAGTRKGISQASHIQNLVDEIAALIDGTIYKLENLQ